MTSAGTSGSGRASAGGSQGTLFTGKAAPGTVEGEVVRVTYENETTGFRVIRVAVDGEASERILVGVFPSAPVGTRVRATGKPQRDDKHGDQFRVETLLPIAPATLGGLERFLGSGIIHGVGPVIAKRIVDVYDSVNERENRVEQPPQEIQAWTVAAMAAIEHR